MITFFPDFGRSRAEASLRGLAIFDLTNNNSPSKIIQIGALVDEIDHFRLQTWYLYRPLLVHCYCSGKDCSNG